MVEVATYHATLSLDCREGFFSMDDHRHKVCIHDRVFIATTGTQPRRPRDVFGAPKTRESEVVAVSTA